MSRRVDGVKLRSWRERLAKFEAGGLSVAEFCRRQKIAPTQFYYWLRRVRETDLASASPAEPCRAINFASDAYQERSRVEIYLGESIRVSLPADDSTLVSSVLRGLQLSSEPAKAFELVDVVAGR